MPKPIFVGYDPKTADRAPVRFGAAAARFTGARLIIGSAFADSVPIGQMGHGHMHEDLGGDASQALEHVRIELSRDGVRAECMPLPGTSAPAALHYAAESCDVGLLVVGSSRRGPGGLLRLGSTGERLIHGAPSPLAIVPAEWEGGGGLHTVGVAYTDTPEGRAALASGIALARRAGATLRLLTAVKPREHGRIAGDGPATESSSYDAAGLDAREATRRILDEAGAEAAGVDVEAEVSIQNPADFLVAASEQLDLLVCGSRGYGPRRAVLLGGVSRRIVAGARCPVIVLARGVDEGLEALVGEPAHATA